MPQTHPQYTYTSLPLPLICQKLRELPWGSRPYPGSAVDASPFAFRYAKKRIHASKIQRIPSSPAKRAGSYRQETHRHLATVRQFGGRQMTALDGGRSLFQCLVRYCHKCAEPIKMESVY